MSDAILAANTEFYRAFEALSLDAMDHVWSHADDIRCIHPGWRELTGWEAVRKSWEAIFQESSYMELNITDYQVWDSSNLGGVFCYENILTFREGQPVRSVMLATNLFRYESERWLMVLHHASPVLTETDEASPI